MRILKRISQYPLLLTVFRIFVGATFIYASYYKITNPADFAHSIYNYHLVPVNYVYLIAICFAWTEFFCGLSLIIGFFTRPNALITSLLLLIFLIAISSVIFRGIDVNCGCFNKTQIESTKENNDTLLEKIFTDKVGWVLFIRDLIMLTMLLPLFFSVPSKFELDYFISKKIT